MKMVKFLTLSEVIFILKDQIRNYGGLYGIKDFKKSKVKAITPDELIAILKNNTGGFL